MATQLLWSPDTCGCRIIQAHDATDLVTPFTLASVVTKCAAHAALTDAEVWDAVWHPTTGENRRKNRVRNRIVAQWGTEIVSFSFSGTAPNRVLTIVTEGLTQNQRDAAQAWADTNIGVGRVVIV